MSNNPSTNIRWDFLTNYINNGKCMFIVSHAFHMNSIFQHQESVIRSWAESVGYPMADTSSVARVAQYLSVTGGGDSLAKTIYLQFLKESLLKKARSEQSEGTNPFLENLASDLRHLTVTEVATRLGYFDFEKEPDNPLFLLAQMPLRVYLTTSFYTFLEDALKAAGKTPHSDYYRWSETLEEDDFEDSHLPLDYVPSEKEPLVYHLNGIDSNADSLVLTEENYFEFFERISQDLKESAGIPDAVRLALARSSLVLFDYNLNSWAFRVLFRGPIKAIFNKKRPLSLCIQLKPRPEEGITDTEKIREYLDTYFRDYQFSIYWGDVRNFTQELWHHWKA